VGAVIRERGLSLQNAYSGGTLAGFADALNGSLALDHVGWPSALQPIGSAI